MKLATMLGDVLQSLIRSPSTEMYPFEKRAIPERSRGLLHWDPERCTGCGLCVKDCPASAIELLVLDRKAKRFAMRYHADRCIFCGQCVKNCRFGCLNMCGDEWELASADKESFPITYGPKDGISEM